MRPRADAIQVGVRPDRYVGGVLTYLLIGLGGAAGSVGRYWLSSNVDQRVDDALPWGTLLVNVLGSLAIGALAALDSLAADTRLFLMVGLCGGFTTFSAFSLQTVELLRDGLQARAAVNIAVSVTVCLLATWAALTVTDRLA